MSCECVCLGNMGHEVTLEDSHDLLADGLERYVGEKKARPCIYLWTKRKIWLYKACRTKPTRCERRLYNRCTYMYSTNQMQLLASSIRVNKADSRASRDPTILSFTSSSREGIADESVMIANKKRRAKDTAFECVMLLS